MNIENLQIEKSDLRKLLGSGSPDAAMLYLYVRCGNDPDRAESELGITATRNACAAATLRQLGLLPEEGHTAFLPGERPNYTERDVIAAMDSSDESFKMLCSEVQRLLGKCLNTEEMKILLSFVRYLGLPVEVISVLVSYCKDRQHQRGSRYNPSLRSIEKEAYRWAEQGIDTLESAAAYIHEQNIRYTQMGQLMNLLQIHGRNLTPAEERYALSWLDMGFDQEVLAAAYERTCLNTGRLSWQYMNKILQSWNENGIKTAQQLKNTDQRSSEKSSRRQLDADEQAAIAKMLQGV